MKLRVLLLLVTLLTACAGETAIPTVPADQVPLNQPTESSDLAQTRTGFYWPTGIIPAKSEDWPETGCDGNSGYFKDEYHTGRDIPASNGDKVFAISDGEVISVSQSGWGAGNVAVLVVHRIANGEPFTAVYGHIQTDLKVGDRVKGGVEFATIGDWDAGTHLHFGIRPGTSLKAPYGRMPCPYLGDTNGFVDPAHWITTYSPWNEGIVSSLEITRAPEPTIAPHPTEESSCQNLHLWEWTQPGTYQITDSQGKIFEITKMEEDRKYRGPESSCGFDKSGIGTYIPDLPYEGVSFEWSGSCTSSENTKYEENIRAVVAGWEEITTNLGTFQALRVDTSNVGSISGFRVEMKGSEWFVCGLGQIYGRWNTDFENHPQYTGEEYSELLSYTPFSSNQTP